jgi:hypothetical protein
VALSPLSPDFSATRAALHQIAFFAIAPARYKAMGRMGLRATPGGFGTPEFDGRVARVEGEFLVHEQDGNIATQQISTIRAAADFFGMDYEVEWFEDFHDPLKPADPDEPLDIDREAALALSMWFEYGFDVLNRLREHGDDADEVTEVQLWPEHFDPATELGDQDRGQRASYGASPGDSSNPEPYIFVAAWSEIDRSNDYWNGASLGYEERSAPNDPVERGLEFLLEGYRVLHAD